MPLSAPVARAIRAVPAVSKQDVVVQFDNVRLDYAGKKKRITALDASNFSIRRGEFVAFTGPSGCGKSTILKLISGIIAPSAGSIFISGREIGAMPVRIGISFQNPTFASLVDRAAERHDAVANCSAFQGRIPRQEK